MKRVVDIYVESVSGSGAYSKLELFNDEKIDINLSVQNIQDISKVYTDFTQSFTIPASPNNNAIFEHFYQSDVDSVGNPNVRRKSYIEIDLTPFRSGKIQLEKSNLKNGQVESYTLTFYGSLLSLKDNFGNDKLVDLDLSAYDVSYSGSSVEGLITSTDYTKNVRFPLITSKRVWTYNDGLSTDIKTSAGAVGFNELFPALKVARIFDAISTKYGITLTGGFLSSSNKCWDRLFLWLKNKETFVNYTNTVQTVFSYVTINGATKPMTYEGSGVIGSTNQIVLSTYPSNRNNTVDIYCESDVPCTIYVECYSYLTYVKTVSFASGTGLWTNLYAKSADAPSQRLSYKIKTDVPANLKNIRIIADVANSLQDKFLVKDIKVANITTVASLSLHNHIPDITVADFFSGILKMFNLTCYSSGTNTFLVETLENFYSKGYIYDITKFVDTDTIDISRVPLYKNISFKHEKSESFINREYTGDNNGTRDYGDTSDVFPEYDNGDFTVSVPFEELLPLNLDGVNLCTSYCLTPKPDHKSYIPKPTLLYLEDVKSCNFYFYNGSTRNNKTTYAPFINEVTFQSTRYSLSFGEEKSVLDNTLLSNGLYDTYYSRYLSNLFNKKNRLVNVKAYFPLSLITKLNLNDRLTIRDKRYIINEIKSDITTGEVNLSLVLDFRNIINATAPLLMSSGGGVITSQFSSPPWSTSTTLSSAYSGVTFSTTTITTDTWVDITIPINPTPFEPILSESGDYIITEDGFNLITESGSDQVIPIDITNVDSLGNSIVDTLNIYQS